MVSHDTRSQVEIISKEFIKPSIPTPDALKQHKLSFLDQIQPPIRIPFVWFYQNHNPSNILDDDGYAHRSQKLKQSFSNMLTKFFPLAGRIKGNHGVDCNDSGAMYIEARAQFQLSLPLIHRRPSSNKGNINEYLPLKDSYIVSDQELSMDIPLAVQVTFFSCGGIAIGICVSHKLADMCTYVSFLHAWASSTCNFGRAETDQIIIPQPNFDLGPQLFPPQDGMDTVFQVVNDVGETLITTRFVFDNKKISEIKEMIVSSMSAKPTSFTRVEALSSYIAKYMIDVIAQSKRGSDTSTKTKYSVGHAVNLRRRLSPALPESAMGNYAILTYGFPTTTNKKNDETHDYGDLLVSLRNAIRKVNHQYLTENVKGGIPYLNWIKQVFQQLEECCLIWFTSWCNFPAYQVDFGWGKPIMVSPPALPTKNNVMMLDSRLGDGIEAWICMREDEMDMLRVKLMECSGDLS